MRAVSLALSHFDFLPQSSVLLATDNTTVVAYISKVGGTRSWSLWKETKSLFAAVVHCNISICVSYIPGKMNITADGPSRVGQILPTEWSLHQDIVNHIYIFNQ